MRKSKKILNIAFIALCFSCLLFGVYAVSKNAKLTVNGTVGMFAHDCMVKASATIQGDGVFETVDGNGETVITPNISGHPSSERVLFTEEKIGFELAKTDVLKEIGTVYFTDLTESGEVETIIIKISLTNYSVYEIFVDAVNTEIENVVTGAYENGQETITNSYETTLMPNENIDIYFSFDLNKVGDDYQSFDSVVPFNIKLNFGKVAGERQLSTPKGLTYNAESAQISIREVSGATGYLVEYLDESNNVVGSETIETATANLQKVPNVPGSYNIRVTALGDGDKLLDSESYTTTNAPIFREGALFSTDWRTQVTNAGIDLQQLTDISFANQKPQDSATYGATSVQTDTYTLNENINVGDGIEVYVSSDNKKLIFYSQDVICSQDGISFDSLTKMTNYTFYNFNTSLMTSMDGMFYNNSSLKKIALTGFDSSNVTSLLNMFCDCHSLEVADVSSLVTNKVTNFQGIFARCYKLYNVNMLNFDLSSATNVYGFFESCSLGRGSVVIKNQGHVIDSFSLLNWVNTRSEDGMIRWGISLVDAGLDPDYFTEFYLTTNKEMVQGTKNENVKIVGTDVETYIDGTKLYFYSKNQITMANLDMMFQSYTNLRKIYIDAIDFSTISVLNSAFNGATNLQEIIITNTDISKVERINNLFYLCNNLSKVDLSGCVGIPPETCFYNVKSDITKNCYSLGVNSIKVSGPEVKDILVNHWGIFSDSQVWYE